MKHSLEKHRAFPVVAWSTFIGFAIFVFYLTTQLQATANELSSRTAQTIEVIESIESLKNVSNQ